jgi:hypothetical protein
MKKITFYIMSMIALSACTKVIDIDLNSSNQQIVVEAKIADDASPCTVKLTKTINFSDPNAFPAVQGAVVKITDGTTIETLTETAAGVYQTTSMLGVSGKTYTLSIVTEGKTITAISTMPAAVPLDTILFLKSAFGNQNGEETYTTIPRFTDPITPGNNYRFIQTINDSLDKTFSVDNDNLTNGKDYQRPIFSQGPKIRLGDSVHFEMQCIDRPIFDYFTSFNSNVSTTPSNPVTNIVGGLGYFSAHTVSRKSVKVN